MTRKKRHIIDYPDVDAGLMLVRKDGLLYGRGQDAHIKEIASLLKIENLTWEKKRKQGFYVPRWFQYYLYNEQTGVGYFPKGAYQLLSKKYYFSKQGDLGGEIDVTFNGTLYPRQEQAVNETTKEFSGLIKAPTGKGKSYIAQGIIAKIKRKTLIISPSVEIARGLYEKFTGEGGLSGCSIGMIGGGKNIKGDVTIIVSDSFANKWKELSGEFPLVIIDEAHEEFTSPKRIEQLCLFKCDYMYGLTATPEREEIPDIAFKFVFGKIYVANIEVLKPVIVKYLYKGEPIFPLDRQDKIRQIFADEERTRQQALVVHQTMTSNRNMGLVLVSQKDVAETLTKAIIETGTYAEEYTGDTKIADRLDVLDRINKNKGVMVSTYQTVGTGFDYPHLDTCFYYCPVKFKGRVKQAVGRILRDCETKDYPLLIDWVDTELSYQGWSRHKLYETFFGKVAIEYHTFMELKYLDNKLT